MDNHYSKIRRSIDALEATPGCTSRTGDFLEELVQRVAALQTEVRNLLSAARLDPSKALDLARGLSIDKSLAWKFSRLVLSRSTPEVIRSIPGPEGFEIALAALAAKGVDGSLLASARAAKAALAGTIEQHCSDREEFEIILDGLEDEGELALARKLAYRGASGLLGRRAKCAVSIAIAVTSKTHPGKLDIHSILGLVGLRRLRAGQLKPAFGVTSSTAGVLALASRAPGTPADFVLRDYSCKAEQGSVNTVPLGDLVEVGQLPVGRHGECNIFLGVTSPGAEQIAITPDHPTITIGFSLGVPSQQLSRIACIERSVLSSAPLRARLINSHRLERPSDPAKLAAAELRIPLNLEVVADASAPIYLACYPEYDRLLTHAFELAGLNRADFVLARVDLEYPPLNTVLEIDATPKATAKS